MVPGTSRLSPGFLEPVLREALMLRFQEDHSFSTINARAEGIQTKPAFREQIRRSHCYADQPAF